MFRSYRHVSVQRFNVCGGRLHGKALTRAHLQPELNINAIHKKSSVTVSAAVFMRPSMALVKRFAQCAMLGTAVHDRYGGVCVCGHQAHLTTGM